MADTETSPVIVLTYPHAGAELLAEGLAASRTLAVTSATGILPLCHDAIAAWQEVDARVGLPSPLAIKSVRTLAATMIAAIQVRAGAPRWCETSYSGPAAAMTFLRVLPGTTFLCLYRDLDGVFADALRAYPWGFGGTPVWPYAADHPGNNVATIVAYWIDRTQALLEFEKAHPESCVRVRYEDLAEATESTIATTLKTIGVKAGDRHVFRQPVAGRDAAGQAQTDLQLPHDRIPPRLEDQIRELRAELGRVSRVIPPAAHERGRRADEDRPASSRGS
jgi:hypothetical protein